jgi:hypothetical protein
LTSFLIDIFLIRQARDPERPLTAWIAAAALSVTIATAVAVQPGGLEDFWLVRDWIVHWVQHGNPYEAYRNLDYPPGAFLLLWPIVLLPATVVPVVVAIFTVTTCGAAAWILAGWFADRLGVLLRWPDRATLVAIMLAGSSVRGAIWRGQSTSLAFLFGALALHWSLRRPILAAVALGLCAFKPHVALGFAFTLLLIEGWRVVLIAAGLVIVKTLIFASSVENTLPQVLTHYAQNLLTLYGGPDRVIGLLSIRWVIEDLIGNYAMSTIVYGVLAAASLALIVAAARRHPRAMAAQVAAACLLWSLLFLPHQLYNGVLAAPALWLLMWPETGLLSRRSIRAIAVGVFVLFGVLDVPRTLRVISGLVGEVEWLSTVSLMLSPGRLAVLFALLLYVLARSLRRDRDQTAAMRSMVTLVPIDAPATNRTIHHMLKRLASGVVGACLLSSVAIGQQPSSNLRIVVISGEGAVNIIQQKTAVPPIVEVRDRNNLPVAGATVTFSVGGSGASFGTGSTLTVVTNAAGQATAAGLTPTAAGAIQINVTAAFQGQVASAAIAQTNFATAAQAAAAAGSSSGASGAAAGAGAGAGGGIPATTIAIVGAAAAGGAVAAVKTGVIGGGGGGFIVISGLVYARAIFGLEATCPSGGVRITLGTGATCYLEPLAGATVSTTLDGATATTDGAGNFDLTTTLPRSRIDECLTYTITITAPGLPTYTVNTRGFSGNQQEGSQSRQLFSISPPSPTMMGGC